MNNLKSELVVHSPNVNSLMKISLGLIFFTILSTAFVYAETLSVDVDGTPFDVVYTTTGVNVIGIESDTESMSLIFSVDVTDLNGKLDVTLDRSFFDSVYDDTDYDFFILADGDESVFEETETKNQSRTLSIIVPYGTEELEIFGSVFNNPVESSVEKEQVPQEVEAPVEVPAEPIVENIPNNECGPGTILENNICVLDNKCGPGTILEDGACVLDSVSTHSTSQSPGMTKELIMSITVAFVIAGIIGIILALISRANRNKN